MQQSNKFFHSWLEGAAGNCDGGNSRDELIGRRGERFGDGFLCMTVITLLRTWEQRERSFDIQGKRERNRLKLRFREREIEIEIEWVWREKKGRVERII